MLAHVDGWIVDPEVQHCVLLGCRSNGYSFDSFRVALERMSGARTWSDVQRAGNYVNTDYARKTREIAYKQFSTKVSDAQCLYATNVANGSIARPYDRATVLSVAQEDDWALRTREAEYKRCQDIVDHYQQDSDFRSMLTGQLDPALKPQIDNYAELYTDYVIDAVSRKRTPEPNDFGDLQFAVYGCCGHLLVTRETLWLDLAAASGKFTAMPV